MDFVDFKQDSVRRTKRKVNINEIPPKYLPFKKPLIKGLLSLLEVFNF